MPIKLNRDYIGIELTVSPDDVQVEGNASAIDDETDRKAEEWIYNQLSIGNVWAWCTVEVTAKVFYKGELHEASDYLGCCSYKGEDDFKQPGGYYEDMIETAIGYLEEQINDTATS